MPNLFTPLQLGGLQLPNRLLMAPLTRCRANADHVSADLMMEHYAQRANAGLIIAGATMAMEGNSSFWMEPGIYSAAQVAGWSAAIGAGRVDAVAFGTPFPANPDQPARVQAGAVLNKPDPATFYPRVRRVIPTIRH